MSGLDLRNALCVTAITMLAGVAATYSGAERANLEAESPAAASVATSLSQNSGGVCYHTFVSEYVCPDSQMVFFREKDIAKVSITVTTEAGQRRTITLPGGVDAILLTKQATEKFLLSYYWAVDRIKAERLTRTLSTIR